jgi:hypothetical protein
MVKNPPLTAATAPAARAIALVFSRPETASPTDAPTRPEKRRGSTVSTRTTHGPVASGRPSCPV